MRAACLEGERRDTALVQAILALAQGLELEVVAEGIETPGQRQLLRLLGCRLGQGYLFAPPAVRRSYPCGQLRGTRDARRDLTIQDLDPR